MSYDIRLKDQITDETLHLDEPHPFRGGTYALGGTTECHLNVTYNYSRFFYKTLDPKLGIRVLYGKTGAETIHMFDRAISQLGDDVSDNYWDATEGNAKIALLQLRALAIMRPDGIWKGD